MNERKNELMNKIEQKQQTTCTIYTNITKMWRELRHIFSSQTHQ